MMFTIDAGSWIARAGGARDEDEAARAVEQLADLVGQADVAEAEHAHRDLAEHEAIVDLGLRTETEAGLSPNAKPKSIATVQLHLRDVIVGRDGSMSFSVSAGVSAGPSMGAMLP